MVFLNVSDGLIAAYPPFLDSSCVSFGI